MLRTAPKSTPPPPGPSSRKDLSYVISRGAGVGRGRFYRDFKDVLLPVAVAAMLSPALYWALITAPANEPYSASITAFVLFAIPFVVGSLLVSFKRYDLPGSAGAGIVLTAFAFAIASLSALRLQLSYSALLFCALIDLATMSYALLRLRHSAREHVAVLSFSGAQDVLGRLGPNAELVSGPEQPIRDYDCVLIDAEAHHRKEWVDYLSACYMRGAAIVAWPKYLERRLGRVDVRSFDISHIVYSPSQIIYSRLKRWFDVAAVVLTAPASLPLCLLLALYVRLKAGSPVLFRQARRGHGGSEFTMVKFRTMATGGDGTATQSTDARVVPGLGILRRLRLDELPQLWNILRGDMSIVGPRPVSSAIADDCERLDPAYANRVLVLPGLTGWAQVVSGYASNPHEEMEKLAYDLYYVKKMSLDLDLRILARTISIVLLGKGAK